MGAVFVGEEPGLHEYHFLEMDAHCIHCSDVKADCVEKRCKECGRNIEEAYGA